MREEGFKNRGTLSLIETQVKSCIGNMLRGFLKSDVGSTQVDTKQESDKSMGSWLNTKKEEVKNSIAAAVTIPDHPSILSGPDIWICDSGCTTHMTPHLQGFHRMVYGIESVTMANGQDESSNLSGEIKGTKVDREGNKEMNLMMHNVSYTPGSAFNLFSTSVLTSKGWLLFGNKKSMWLEKDGMKVVFDIKVSTDKGVLYCMKVDRISKNCEMANFILRDRRKKSAEIKKFKKLKKKKLRENDFDRTVNDRTNRTRIDTSSGTTTDTTNDRTRNVTPNRSERTYDRPIDRNVRKNYVTTKVTTPVTHGNKQSQKFVTTNLEKSENVQNVEITAENRLSKKSPYKICTTQD